MRTIHSNKAAIISSYNDNLIRAILGISVGERPVPVPGPDEVVIKVSASPVNPSDIAFLRGGYNVVKELPAVPGFEGAGTVVDAGNNLIHWKGKRVSFFTQEEGDGAWAEYVVTDGSNCLLIEENMADDQAACFSINPFTAYGMFQMARRNATDVIVQNAAAGQVGEFIRYFAKEKGLEVINVVRRKESAEAMINAGNDTLCSVEENYTKKLKEMVSGRKAIVFDAVGGEATGQFMNILPSGSTIVLYGGLSGGMIGDIDPLQLIFHDKCLTGFNLNNWRKSLSREELGKVSSTLQKIISEEKCLTRIQGSFPLTDIVAAIRSYIKNMSAGKVVLKPGRIS